MISAATRTRLDLFLQASVLYLALTAAATCHEGDRSPTCDDEVSLLQVGTGLMQLGKQWHDRGEKLQANLSLQRSVQAHAMAHKVAAVSDARGAFGVTLVRVGANGTDGVGLLQGLPKADSRCLINTGKSCAATSCSKGLGKTKCRSARCLCETGCAGADGVCSTHKYKVILKDCTIQNFRYGTYLYAQYMGGHLSTSIDKKAKQNRFMLVETHDGKFIIYSKIYPDHVVAVSRHMTKSMKGFSANQENIEGALDIDHISDSLPADHIPAARDVALAFTEPPGGYDDDERDDDYSFDGDRPVMLQSAAFKRHFIYAPRVSMAHNVFTTYDDPGDGGLWIFDPPLPKTIVTGRQSNLEKFKGHKCKKDCYDNSSHDTIQLFGVTQLALGIVIVLLLIGYLVFLICSGQA